MQNRDANLIMMGMAGAAAGCNFCCRTVPDACCFFSDDCISWWSAEVTCTARCVNVIPVGMLWIAQSTCLIRARNGMLDPVGCAGEVVGRIR